MISESQMSITDLGMELEKIDKVLPKAKRRDEVLKSLDSDKKSLKDKLSRMKQSKQDLVKFETVIKQTKEEMEKYGSLKKEIDKLQETENSLSSAVSSLDTEVKSYKNQIEEEETRISGLEKQLSEFKTIRADLKAKKSAVGLLTKLRHDIRSIREKVRMKFLNDLKIEFQRKFEEIRRFEEEYSVDVKLDYEPIAYAAGDEVGISTLSGGEKTSVALSYRLALADIAAQIGGIQESELLMLDEPTTGFDEDDIRALPEALVNLRTIPQIVIVTHAEELKEAADYKFKVDKKSGISKVKLLEM
jgi:exonuclease SbcC